MESGLRCCLLKLDMCAPFERRLPPRRMKTDNVCDRVENQCGCEERHPVTYRDDVRTGGRANIF
jgi:hypothetical protein